jgi:hypothetical protein
MSSLVIAQLDNLYMGFSVALTAVWVAFFLSRVNPARMSEDAARFALVRFFFVGAGCFIPGVQFIIAAVLGRALFKE